MSKKEMPNGYGMVQTAIMQRTDLSIQSKAIYSLLASMTGSNEFCWPSVALIGEYMNLSKTSIIKYLKELENKTLIEKSKKYPNNALKRNNQYKIFFMEVTTKVKQSEPSGLSQLDHHGSASLNGNSNIKNNNKENSKITKPKVLTPEIALEKFKAGKTPTTDDGFQKLQVALFNQKYAEIFDEELSWNGKTVQWRTANKNMRAAAKNFDRWFGKFELFCVRFIADDHLIKMGFNPSTMAWTYSTLTATDPKRNASQKAFEEAMKS